MISKTSQKWVLLQFLKKYPNLQIVWTDFQRWVSWKWIRKPLVFIWAKPGSRISELYRIWLLIKVGKKKSNMKFQIKCKDQDVYAISELWLNYNLV